MALNGFRHSRGRASAGGRKGKLVGILTNRDVRFAQNKLQPIAELMTKNLITVREGVGRRKRAGFSTITVSRNCWWSTKVFAASVWSR